MTFHDLNINNQLFNALDDLGFITPTPIQEQAFNVVSSGKDVVGIAQTGTGKTFAYMLPILKDLKFSEQENPRVLVLVPTRELVVQVVDEIEKLSKYIPKNAVTLVQEILEEHPLDIKIVKERLTKHGDFKRTIHNKVQITINNNLNQYQFLLTLIHELAHFVTFKKNRFSPKELKLGYSRGVKRPWSVPPKYLSQHAGRKFGFNKKISDG